MQALPCVLGAAAFALAAAGFARAPDRSRHLLHAASGAAAGSLFVLDAGAWLEVVVVLAASHAVVASLPSWRDVPRRAGVLLRDAAAGPGLALAVAAILTLAIVALGGGASLAGDVALAMPPDPASRLLLAALLGVALTLAAAGTPRAPAPPLALARTLALVALALTLARAAWIASSASLPMETQWSEPPAIVNALKLAAHEPLYGPPAQLDSYTYSPGLDLLDRALLAPLGLALSLHAHRAVMLAEQLAALGVLAWAIVPIAAGKGWTRLGVGSVLAGAVLANLLAPAVHPDHLVLVAYAVAVALLVAEPRWPRWAWWTALALVAPVAMAAKLTGAGLGAGLVLVFAWERRWRACGAAVLSSALGAATVPLFDATLGRYSFYAIHVQATHPVLVGKLLELPLHPAGAVAAGAVLFVVATYLVARAPLDRDVARVAILTGGVAAAALPGWIKYAGRDNNLALLALGSTLVVLLTWVKRPGGARALHPLLGPAVLVLGLAVLVPPELPVPGTARAQAARDEATIRDLVRAETDAGRPILLMLHAAAWVEAGRRDVPRDRLASAIELFYGGLPEGDLLFRRIEDGGYPTLVVTGAQLRGGPTPLGRFGARLREAIGRRYALAGPPGAVSIDATPGLLVFRRR